MSQNAEDIYIDNILCHIEKVHIDDIRKGDTILFNGSLKTVCGKDIKRDKFMGTSIFGDSYDSGYKPVEKVLIFHAKPDISH